MVYDGYGSVAEYVAVGFARAGVHLSLHPTQVDFAGLSSDLLSLLQRDRSYGRGTHLFFTPPTSAVVSEILSIRRVDPDNPVFINTMWESTALPRGWAESLNRCDGVIAPSNFVAEVFHRAGVRRPIQVVPEGCDPNVYHYLRRPARDTYTTLSWVW